MFSINRTDDHKNIIDKNCQQKALSKQGAFIRRKIEAIALDNTRARSLINDSFHSCSIRMKVSVRCRVHNNKLLLGGPEPKKDASY
jgi:hypothetical protein